MSDKSRKPSNATRHESPVGSGSFEREETAGILARTLDEAYWARVRAHTRTRPIGFHGEDFERRASVVEHIVEKFNERAVKTARKNALRAGWTKQELAGLSLDAAKSDDLSGSGTAQA